MVHRVADLVPAPGPVGPPVRVGVDGTDGSGKTWFADELAEVLQTRGRHVVRAGVDGFHRPRAQRYRRGRTSPEGFWLDSYDYDRMRSDLLAGFAADGNRRYRTAAHDVVTDSPVDARWCVAAPDAVLVVDGIFLQRDELAVAWDLTVFLQVDDGTRFARMAARDGCPADPSHPTNRRYVDGQRIYLAQCDPVGRADVLVDNTDLAWPTVLRVPRTTSTPVDTSRTST